MKKKKTNKKKQKLEAERTIFFSLDGTHAAQTKEIKYNEQTMTEE